MGFSRRQVGQLLQPINPKRVLRDGKGHSHVSQQDVLAHLTRIFGFGNFDTEILNVECVFETERMKDGEPTGRWDVCYRAAYRLTVKDEHGVEVCHFEDGSTATAQNQSRGDAHDLAYKSALSLAKKRAAIPLGDQFGLSLYNKGQLEALVRGTLVLPEGETAEDDVQEGIVQQVSLGNDEVERPLDASEPAAAEPHVDMVAEYRRMLADASTVDEVRALWRGTTADLKSGHLDRTSAAQVQKLCKQRFDEVAPADALPTNQNGSVSRSKLDDETLAKNGLMTDGQVREHGRLERETVANPKPAERLAATPDDDPWTAPEVNGWPAVAKAGGGS